MIPIFPNIQALAADLIRTAGKTKSDGQNPSSSIDFAEFLERLADSPRQALEIKTGDNVNLNGFSMVGPTLDFPEANACGRTFGSSFQGNPAVFAGDATATESMPSLEIGLTLRFQDIQNLLRDSASQTKIFVSLPDSRAEDRLSDFPETAAGGFQEIVNDRSACNDRIPEPAKAVAMFVSPISEKTADIPGGELSPRTFVISFKPRDLLDLMIGRIKIAEITGLPEQEKQSITIDELKNLLNGYDAKADLRMTIPVTANLREKVAQSNRLTAVDNQIPYDKTTTTNLLQLDPRKILDCGPDDPIPATLQSYFDADDFNTGLVRSKGYYPRFSAAFGFPFGRVNFAIPSAVDSPSILPQAAANCNRPDQSAPEEVSPADISDCRKGNFTERIAREVSTPVRGEDVSTVDQNPKPAGNHPELKTIFQETQHIFRTNGRLDFPAISPRQELAYPDLPGQLKAAMQYYRPGTELSIRIEPQHLGKIKMKISYENGRVEAALRVESDEVKNILQTDLKRLKEYLDIDSLKIDIDNPDRRNPAAQFAWGDPRRSTENRNRTVFSGRPENTAAAAKKSGAISGPWQTRIDLFA